MSVQNAIPRKGANPSPESALMPAAPDFDTVKQSLRWALSRPGSVVEVRTIEQYRGRSQVGYFNDIDMCANAVHFANNENLAGIYATLNPVHPDLFSRCSNRMVGAGAGQFTKDAEILERRGLLLDFDPKRFSGISSTDAEHDATLEYMREVTWDLTQFHGFPVPCLIDSGNGGHGKYLTEPLPNTLESTQLIRTFLHVMDARYGTGKIDIDKSVFNASRIVRIPGTIARKGEDTDSRPHRTSRILQDYDPLDTVARDTLVRFIGLYGHLVPSAHVTALGKPADPTRHIREYPEDERIYRTLNMSAKLRYHEYCNALLGDFVTSVGDEYRIYSDALGRDLEEAIRIGPWGIKDYGVADMGDETEGRRQAVTLISELLTAGDKRKAAELLAIALNTNVTAFSGNPIMPAIKDHSVSSALQSPLPITMPDALMGTPVWVQPKSGFADYNILTNERTKWMVPGFLIENGYTMVSAPTKMGKSTLTRQLIAACLTGGQFLGVVCPVIEVLYIAYEDMANDFLPDIRDAVILALRGMGYPEDCLYGKVNEAMARFHYYARELDANGQLYHNVPTGASGIKFIAELTSKTLPNVKLTCVDPIRLLKDETIRSRDIVTQQYHEGIDFMNMAYEGGTAVWGLHHNNKESGKKSAEGNDPLLSAGGTAAILASAQCAIVFQGDRVPDGIDGATGLYIASRIGQTQRKLIKFHQGQFYLAPADSEIYYERTGQSKGNDTNEAVKIVAFLTERKAATSTEIADAMNISRYLVEKRLLVLQERGVVDCTVEKLGAFKGRGAPPRIWFIVDPITLPQ